MLSEKALANVYGEMRIKFIDQTRNEIELLKKELDFLFTFFQDGDHEVSQLL